MGFLRVLMVVFFSILATGVAQPEEKIPIGVIEEVVLLPWGIKMPARIDTGAARSSLDAPDLEIHNGIAEFKVSKKYGGHRLRLPVVGWVETRTSEGRERRPIVEVTLCVGTKEIRVEASLNDRSQVRYPVIVGRDVLKDNFVVDPRQSRSLTPKCAEASAK
jgi:hypothetical protein